MAVRGPLRKPLFPPSLVGYLWFHLILPSKTSILQAISNKIHSFKLLWRNVNESCDVDVAIVRAGYQSKKKQGKDYSVFFFFLFFLLDQSHLRVFMVRFFYLLCCWRQQWKENTLFAGVCIYSRGISSFTDQRTTFTHAHGAILQSGDFNKT